jgi:hypothetical protein
MGFWGKAFRVLQDTTSLGGTYRLRNLQERLQRLHEVYNRICSQIAGCNADLVATIARIDKQADISRQRLRSANKMLNPLGNGRFIKAGPALPSNAVALAPGRSTAVSASNSWTGNDYVPSLIGIGAGAGGAAASWGAIQLLAHASTGTAMVGLHGITATNAGWAYLGGGSLAVGGGGMAAGHLVLPGIGTAIAIAVSSTLSYREAKKVEIICTQLEGTNEKNSAALLTARSDVSTVRIFETKLAQEDQLLSDTILATRTSVLPFGILSHYWRLLRYFFRGYYYSSKDLLSVDRLDAAVRRFVSAFAKR